MEDSPPSGVLILAVSNDPSKLAHSKSSSDYASKDKTRCSHNLINFTGAIEYEEDYSHGGYMSTS